jgi:beta-lactamase regulating signal transducer with metallopeptidase domain
VAVCGVWRGVRALGGEHSAKRRASLLFAVRMAPLVTATAITLGLALPSFLLLEPRAIDEPLSGTLLVLALCGFLLVAVGTANSLIALIQAAKPIATWTSHAHLDAYDGSIPLLRIAAAAPPLTVAGILRPRMFLSDAAAFVLAPKELQSALRHEVAHVRRRDNLKKLVLRFVAFPGMVELEAAWNEATEMAADDAAVSSANEALDLAAALVKVSRLVCYNAAPVALTTALVHSPAESVNARVERLIAWSEAPKTVPQGLARWYALAATLALVAGISLTYTELLMQIHAATEWLVR